MGETHSRKQNCVGGSREKSNQMGAILFKTIYSNRSLFPEQNNVSHAFQETCVIHAEYI